MKKITIKKIPFKLKGEVIKENEALSFKAINRDNKEVYLKDIKGIKVISFFPDINTKVCDAQTKKIGELAYKNKTIKFISITTDEVEVINKWCLAKEMDNIDIWSDKEFSEFGSKTNTVIPRLNKLARGFMILDNNNKIINISMKKELTEEPDYSEVTKLLG